MVIINFFTNCWVKAFWLLGRNEKCILIAKIQHFFDISKKKPQKVQICFFLREIVKVYYGRMA